MLRNTNISRKERQVFTMSDLRGVDLSSSKFDVAPNRALDMRNFIKENGVTQKRHGWREEYSVDERIVGMYYYEHKEHKAMLIVVETGIYKIGDPFSDGATPYRLTTFDDSSSPAELTDTAQFFYLNGRCYIVTQAGIFIYGLISGDYTLNILSDAYDYSNIYGLSGTYIPTTSKSYDANGAKIYSMDAVNLLTRWRKNVCDFSEGNRGRVDSLPKSGEMNSKDGLYTNNEQILRVYYNEGWLDVDENTLSNDQKKQITGYFETGNFALQRFENTLEYFEGSYIKKDGTEHSLIGTKGQGTIALYGFDEPLFTLDSSGHAILYGAMYVGYISLSNKEVQCDSADIKKMTFAFIPEDAESRIHLISNCTVGCLYGTDGNNDRLFLTGNPDEPNIVRFSEPDDFSYFPDDNALIIGSAEVPVNAFARLTDATMAVFKEKNHHESTIYYLTEGRLDITYDDNGELLRAKAAFPTVAGSIGEGCVTNAASCNFSGDSIILSDSGVYGIVLSNNLTTNLRYAKERSYSIGAALKGHDLSRAVGSVFGNRYYLFVDGVCYIADADYKYYRENDVDESYNYEWWIWDNVPATCVRVMNGQLWFGTADGRICVFDGEYTDRTHIRLGEGETSVSDGRLIVSDELFESLEGTDTFFAESPLYALGGTYSGGILGFEDGFRLSTDDAERIEEDIIIFTEGMTVYDEDENEYVVAEIDRGTGEITFSDNSPVDGTRLYLSVAGKHLKIKKGELTESEDEDDNGPVVALMAEGFENRKLYLKGQDALKGYFTRYKPIVAEWITAYFDMGTSIQSKTIESLTVGCENGDGQMLEVGYETRIEKGAVSARSMGSFSFDDFSFDNFTFETGFAATHTIRKTIRDFNYIRFALRSDSGSSCALHEMTAVYKINRMLRGVK